jgi:hypothetical protein
MWQYIKLRNKIDEADKNQSIGSASAAPVLG